MSRLRVVKGHGTGNDFVILPDLDGTHQLTPRFVRALCDRRFGIGADGVLRAVRSSCDADAAGMTNDADLFMDYRNADGSMAEMCGNGIRVFVRYLQREGLAGDSPAIATRGGVRRVWASGDDIAVDMGTPRVLRPGPTVSVPPDVMAAGAATVFMPNPHVVVPMSSAAALDSLDLSSPPVVEPAGPDGQNVEFALRTHDRRIRMRVHERGVGETSSCGTGICAAVAATATAEQLTGDDADWQVDIPGGRCRVTLRADGTVVLTGPAVLVADIELDGRWLASSGW